MKTREAVTILKSRLGNDPERLARMEAYREAMEVAMQIYELRTAAGLTQKQLAEKIGTAPSVISRLEDSDYEGHSLAMLRRIAGALGKRVTIRFEDLEPAGTAG
jgi:ribosome-binding protein aMBF1 (putative translation factor)